MTTSHPEVAETGKPAAPPPGVPAHEHLAMSHRQVLETLSGLLIGMFVAILSSTVVANALPIIVPDLKGDESGYTWVIVAALLATTISTPIWGKLSDLFSKKALVQVSLVIFVIASAVAGLSENMGMLITCRVFQGIGAGGLTALAQVILATIVSPRERGRYSGYLGATFALATVLGPLIGGTLTEHLSWRWCFYVGIPFAVLAFIVLQITLKLPTHHRKVQIDYLGAALLAAGVSSLLIWVSLAGTDFDWWSWQTALMVGGGIVLLGLTVLAERQAPEPMIPLRLFRHPTIVLSSLASLFVGTALFGGTVFLSQYFQLARGESPTRSGLMTLPLVFGLFLSSMLSGQVITRTGRWKIWLVAGGILLTAGLGLLAIVKADTDYWVIGVYMFMTGAGVGMMMQNLVVAVQNLVAPQDLGAASSFVAFTRTLGGAIGVTALGAVLAHRVADHLEDGLRGAGIAAGSLGGSNTAIPDVSSLKEPIKGIVENAYGSGIADVFLFAAPLALIALLIVLFIRETKLRGREEMMAAAAGTPIEDEVNEQRWNAPSDHDSHIPLEEPVEAPVATAQAVPAPGLAIFGQVSRSTAQPLPDARLTLADQTGRQVAHAISDAEGNYQLPLANGGSYLLIISAPHLSPAATVIAVADQPVRHDVVLTGRSEITGRVLGHDVRSNEHPPIGGALVTLTDVTGQVVGHARTTSDGAFSFGGLTAGAYVLTAQSREYRPVARSVEVEESSAVVCDLTITGGGHLEGGIVAGSDGSAVREATVTLLDGEGQISATMTTAADGRYRFENLEPGRYTLTASGYAPVAQEVHIVDGEVVSQQMRLGSSASPQVIPLTKADDSQAHTR